MSDYSKNKQSIYESMNTADTIAKLRTDLATLTKKRDWLKTECKKVKSYSKDMEQHYMDDLAAAKKDAKSDYKYICDQLIKLQKGHKIVKADLKRYKEALEGMLHSFNKHWIRFGSEPYVDITATEVAQSVVIAEQALNPKEKQKINPDIGSKTT